MTEPDRPGSTDRKGRPRLEIGALVAQLSGFVTGPLGMIVGWFLTARSQRWDAREKTLAQALAIPMGVLWIQPFSGTIGLLIELPTALIAIGIAVYLYRSASRSPREPRSTAAADGVHLRSRTSPGAANVVRMVSGWALTAAAGFAAWWGWMGWDDTYQLDSQGRAIEGPYEAWQVISSAVTVVVIVLLAWWWLSRAITVSAVTIGYAVGWGLSAIPSDETGLSLVGLVMVLLAVFAGATLLVVLADTGETELRRARLR